MLTQQFEIKITSTMTSDVVKIHCFLGVSQRACHIT